MHESHRHLPIEYAMLAFITGFAGLWALLGVLAVYYAIKEFMGQGDSRPDSARPFMTPDLRARIAGRKL
jgi:hypothetical protein